MKPKTFEEHQNDFGGTCPFCRSEALNFGSYDYSAGVLYQEVHCLDCDSEYEDVYELVRYLSE